MLWERSNVTNTFSKGVYLTLPNGKSIPRRSPRYCASTNELIFTSRNLTGKGKFNDSGWDLWVIKGFDPKKLDLAAAR